ncbi:MAG: hypothetical protein M3437_21155 [Chloroflexota bacterium]|nr:hypothetical protein [Chloroflexota bacterium]MDQ5864703.1 hypothetical protein [Chloroflexota bacterium]
MLIKRSSRLRLGTRALLLIVLGLVLVGCSSVSVENTSTDQTARVTMYLPDRSGSTSFTLAPGQSGSELTVDSGLVVILVMPNDEYVKELEEMKKYYQAVLRVPTFTEEDYKDATKKVREFDDKIKTASIGGNSCYVRVADNADVIATVNWDEPNLTWKITCVTRKQETESVPSD